MVSKAVSGYIYAFSVYTGKGPRDHLKGHVMLDPDCSRMTKTLMGLLDMVQLMDNGSHVYFDNYLSSPELLKERFYRQIYTCGTVISNRKKITSRHHKTKLKPRKSVFRCSGPILIGATKELSQSDVLFMKHHRAKCHQT